MSIKYKCLYEITGCIEDVNTFLVPLQDLPKQEQGEPVAEMTAPRAMYFMERFKREEKLLGPNEQAAVDFVTAILNNPPQQRTWVGLTDEEIRSVEFDHIRRRDYARAIEAKLKEKNT